MSNAKLKTRIKRFFTEELEQKGFSLKKSRIPERFLLGLRQGIEFQPGTGHLDGKYTLNVFWSFTHVLDEGLSMTSSCRIGSLSGTSETWFSRQEASLDSDFNLARELVRKFALPYLDKYNSIENILAGVSRGDLEASRAFGIDGGWQEFNQGYCFAFLKNNQEAVKHYRAVVEQHSDREVTWVQERKRAAISEIQRLCG